MCRTCRLSWKAHHSLAILNEIELYKQTEKGFMYRGCHLVEERQYNNKGGQSNRWYLTVFWCHFSWTETWLMFPQRWFNCGRTEGRTIGQILKKTTRASCLFHICIRELIRKPLYSWWDFTRPSVFLLSLWYKHLIGLSQIIKVIKSITSLVHI